MESISTSNNNSLRNKIFLLTLIVFIFFTSILVYIEYNNYEKNFLEEQKQKNNYIIKSSQSLLEDLKSVTEQKIKFMLSAPGVTKAFKEQNREMLYKKTKNFYKRQSILNPHLKIMSFRNVDGSTFLRVHKPKMFGDKLNKKRTIILDTNHLQTPHYGFEVGKLKMTYRVVVPIYHNEEHIGLVEVGIEPEYLLKRLQETFDIKTALLIKKDFLSVHMHKIKDLTYFDEFALVRGDKLFFNNKKNIDIHNPFKLQSTSEYMVDTNFNLYNHKKEVAAKLLFASKISGAEDKITNIITKAMILFMLMLILFLILNFIISYFLNQQEKGIKIIKEKTYISQAILDGASSMLILSNGKEITKANHLFFNFYSEYENLDAFKKDYACICDNFEPFDDPNYIQGKIVDGLVWVEYIIDNPQIIHKAMIKKDDIENHFIVNVNKVLINNKDLYVIDLSDITKELQQQNEIQEQNKLLYNQSKMASLGEMIGNIAHQWRQPLSVISTNSTGMILQDELGVLNTEKINHLCTGINDNAQYLSETIDDFKNYIKGEKVIRTFDLKDTVHSVEHLLESSIKNSNIFLDIIDAKNITVSSSENELKQCLINIINNSKDALENIAEEDRYIKVTYSKNDTNVSITIMDSAGGIPEDILPKIFEPYFTTKHKSRGTGLGLYMTYQLITDSLEGKVSAINDKITYNKKEFIGAKFTIELPIINNHS